MRACPRRRCLPLALTACAETITKHGHQFQENDLQQITTGHEPGPGEDHARLADDDGDGRHRHAFYYISSTEGQTSFFKPIEKDRKVLAVYFSPMGSVDRVAQYGLKDGKVFDYVKSETPSPPATRAS